MLLFESRMTTPRPSQPTSTQFFFGVQWLDRSQKPVASMSRTSAAMAVPPNDAERWINPGAGIFLGATLPLDRGRCVTFSGQNMDKVLNRVRHMALIGRSIGPATRDSRE